jgi:hypothetical protein
MNSCFLSISSSSPVSLDNVTELSFSLETVKQGKGLLAADINGKSDPYAVIKIGDKQIHKTEIEKATLNPVWAEKFKTYGFVFFFFLTIVSNSIVLLPQSPGCELVIPPICDPFSFPFTVSTE